MSMVIDHRTAASLHSGRLSSVPGQMPRAHQPAECPLHRPPAGKHHEPAHGRGGTAACESFHASLKRETLSIADYMRTSLVADALRMAASTRGGLDGAVGRSCSAGLDFAIFLISRRSGSVKVLGRPPLYFG